MSTSITANNVQIGDVQDMLNGCLEKTNPTSVHIICDTHTKEYCLDALSTVRWPAKPQVVEIEHGEEHKNLASCEQVWSQLAQKGADRGSLVVNLGGGVVTDLGGFCAASYMRGMRFIHVPTSLLAMTDAAIGGKHGVDFQSFKNYIGCFANAEGVFVDPVFLETLPERELISGFAEVLKHALIADAALFDILVATEVAHLNWSRILPRSIAVKTGIVQQDPFEKGLRQALNFGHTIGHVIETHALLSGVPMPHGEAIALGMKVECKLSSMILGLSSDDEQRIMEMLGRDYGHLQMPAIDVDRLWELIKKDKKKHGKSVLFPLLPRIGAVQTAILIPPDQVNTAFLHFVQ